VHAPRGRSHARPPPVDRGVACPSASGPPTADEHDLEVRARALRHGHPLHPSGSVAATRRQLRTGRTARRGRTSHRESQRAQSRLGSLGLPLCPLCPLWQAPWPARHSPPDVFAGPPLTVILTGGPGLRCRVACPSASGPPAADGHVLAMQGGVRRPMATPCAAMPPNNLVDPHHRHPDRRAEGPQWRDPFKQLSARHPTPCRNSISGVAARR